MRSGQASIAAPPNQSCDATQVARRTPRYLIMLYTIVAVLLILWLLGLLTSTTMGGLVHVLLVLAIVVVLVRVISGRRAL